MPAEFDQPADLNANVRPPRPIERPTGLHRYVRRPYPSTHAAGHIVSRNVHQMEWAVVDFSTGSNGAERLEWRDVPLVNLDFAAGFVDQAVNFVEPPDDDIPALKQRIARVDESLAKQLQRAIERNSALAQMNKELNELTSRQGKALEWVLDNGRSAHRENIRSVALDGLGRLDPEK